MLTRNVGTQATGEFSEVEFVEVGGDGLGNGVEGMRFLVHLGTDRRARGDVDIDAVEGSTELDGDPGSGRFGGDHGGKVATVGYRDVGG